MKESLGESITFRGEDYNLVQDCTIDGVRHVVYRPDADNPTADIVLTENGDLIETSKIKTDWSALRKGIKTAKKDGRKLTAVEKKSLKKLSRIKSGN